MPVVLVAGRFAEKLLSGEVRASYSGKIEPGQSQNVIADFGDVKSDETLILATSLSGWYAVAAERGTEIAAAIALAERFGQDRPVKVIGGNGHEILHHIGMEAYLAEHPEQLETVGFLVHLGANVGLTVKDSNTGEMKLAPGINDVRNLPDAGRAVFVRMDKTVFAKVEDSLLGAGLSAIVNPPKFFGEGELWAEVTSAPLMSFTGLSPIFHTPLDTPKNATSPAAMATVVNAIGNAIEAFLENQ
jgi:hypothetical protein